MIIIIIEANGSDLVFVTVQKTSQVSLMQIKLTPSVTSVGLFVLLLGVWLISGVLMSISKWLCVCLPGIKKQLGKHWTWLSRTCRWKVESWIEADGFNGNYFWCSLDVSPARLRKSCKCTCGRKCCRLPPLLGKEPWDGSSVAGQLSFRHMWNTFTQTLTWVFPHFQGWDFQRCSHFGTWMLSLLMSWDHS